MLHTVMVSKHDSTVPHVTAEASRKPDKGCAALRCASLCVCTELLAKHAQPEFDSLDMHIV